MDGDKSSVKLYESRGCPFAVHQDSGAQMLGHLCRSVSCPDPSALEVTLPLSSIPSILRCYCILHQVAAVLASAALVGLLFAFCCFCYRRRGQRERTREEEEEYIAAVQNFVKFNKRNV